MAMKKKGKANGGKRMMKSKGGAMGGKRKMMSKGGVAGGAMRDIDARARRLRVQQLRPSAKARRCGRECPARTSRAAF